MRDEYIYLADLGERWSVNMPEAQKRLPLGYVYTLAGDDGAWAEDVGENQRAAVREQRRWQQEAEQRAETAVRDWRRQHDLPE